MQPHLFFLKTDAFEDDSVLRHFLQKIPAERREKALRFRIREGQVMSAAASALLVCALKAAGIAEEDWQFDYGKYGKPYLKNRALFFSLSHAVSAVLCYTGEQEAGCDIEPVRTPVLAVVHRRFCEEEKDLILSIPDTEERNRTFYRLWTIKESVLKALGCGLSIPLDSFCIRPESDTVHVRTENIDRTLYYREYDTGTDLPSSCAAFDRAALPDAVTRLTLDDVW